MNNDKITETTERRNLLTEIEQTPEEYIPELLKFVRLFRQSMLTRQISINAWDSAINEINNSEHNQKRIKQLFDNWNELDDEIEQKENLKIIENMENFSI